MIHALLMVATLAHLGSVEELERELARRQVQRASAVDGGLVARVEAMMAELHPEARAIADDESPLIAVLGTRRSGKSRTCGRSLLRDALTIKDARLFYVNETWQECDRIIWTGNGRDGLLTLNQRFQLGGIPNLSNHTIVFPQTGGIITVMGADDVSAVQRIRGAAPHKVVIDEAQKMRHLDVLVEEAAGAAMMDAFMLTGRDAQTIIQGTASEDLAGMLFEVTRDDSTLEGWSRHYLDVYDNPFFGATREERFKNTVEKYCRFHRLSLDHPKVQREWFRKWVREDARYTYATYQVPEHKLCWAAPRWVEAPNWRKDDKGRPLFLEGGVVDWTAALDDLPKGHDWRFTLATDHGYLPDPFAFVLWAWSWTYPRLLEVASWARCEMDSDDQLAEMMQVAVHAPPSIVTGDLGGANRSTGKGWSKRWNERFGYGIVEAEKHHKHEAQQLFNTDIRKGRIGIRLGSPLHEQLKRVRNLPKAPGEKGKLEEDPKIPNDITDAGLYGHRHTFQHLAERKVPAPPVGSEQYFQRLEAEYEAQDDDYDREPESYYG